MAKKPDPIPPEGTPPPLAEGYLTAKDAAERMGLSMETVRAMCKDGILTGTVQERENGPWRIPKDAVDSWLAYQSKRRSRKQIVKWGAMATLLALLFAAGSFLADSLNIADRWRNAHATSTPTVTPQPTFTPIPTVTPTPLPFPPAQVGETLILIASFNHTEGVTDTDIEHEIRRAIRQAADELETPNLRVEVEPTHLKADDQGGAEALGKQYNASNVIWGGDTGVRVTVNFLNLKHPDFVAARAQINETQRTQLANPSAFASLVTRDLPSQLSFLSLFAVGQSYFTEEAYEDSIRLIEKGIAALMPGDNANTGLADAYFRLGWLYQTLDRLQEATDRYTQAIQLNPQYLPAYNNRGAARYAQGKLDAAVQDYDKAIELDPLDPIAYNNRGATRYAQGKLDAAIQDYDKAIELDPQAASAYTGRGATRADQGNPDAAIQDYDKAIELDPQDPIAYNNRGIAGAAQGRLDAAIQDYNKAIELDPHYARAYNNRGLVRATQGKLDAAIQDYDKTIELDPHAALAYYNRGNARKAQGDLAAAIQDYDKAIDLDPKFAAAYDNRGNARGDQGDLDTAIQDYDKAIDLDPHAATAYNNRGSVYYDQGDLVTAIQDYNKAIEIDPKFAAAYKNRGIAREAKGDRVGAISDFRRYVELSPQAYDRQQVEQRIAELEQQLNKP